MTSLSTPYRPERPARRADGSVLDLFDEPRQLLDEATLRYGGGS